MINLSDLGHFHIETHLGSGRYTDVYRAVDTVRKRTVALKVLKPNLLPGGKSLSPYLSKAEQATDLIHPYIAWIWEVGEENGIFYLVERFVNGPSLATLLSQSGTVPWEQIYPILDQIAQGLDFAHGKEWVHGDIRPEKILISPDLGAVLIDFGFMHMLQASLSPSSIQSALSTTPYLAPEVQQGEPLSPKSDQYSLACVAIEALMGRVLPDVSVATTPEANLQEAKRLPTSWPASVPWQVGIALDRALSNDPTQRYSTVGEFIGAPKELTTQVEQTPETRTQWEAETRARLEAEEQSRLKAEEQIRLAALEQARREIQEELQQKNREQVGDLAKSIQTDSQQHPEASQPGIITTEFRQFLRRWIIWMFIGILIAVLAGLWLFNLFSGSGTIINTDTPTFQPVYPTYTLVETSFPATTSVPIKTLTYSPTTTHTKIPSPTLTSTPSSTPTGTTYPFHPLFHERTPPDIQPVH